MKKKVSVQTQLLPTYLVMFPLSIHSHPRKWLLVPLEEAKRKFAVCIFAV